MSDFKSALAKKIDQSQYNDFGIENYDEGRFGKYKVPEYHSDSFFFNLKKFIKKTISYKKNCVDVNKIDWLCNYQKGLQRIFNNLNKDGKDLLVDLIAYRCLRYKKVKLSRNNEIKYKSDDYRS